MNPNASDEKPPEDSASFPQMEEEGARKQGKSESKAPDPQELRAIRDILLSLSKVLKASRVYDPNNPAYQKLSLDYANSLTEFLKDREILVLDIDQLHIRYGGEAVYQNPDPSESLSFHLYKDGLRQLRFLQGLDFAEIQDFLALLKSALFEAEPDDDLATLLWERDFANIQSLVVDAPGDGEEGEGKSELSSLSRRIVDHGRTELGSRSVLESPALGGGGPAPDPADSMPAFPGRDLPLFSLGEQEVEKVKSEMADEARRDLGQEFISLLLEILSAKEDIAGSKEVLAIMERIADSYCLQGDFLKAFRILRDLRQLVELPLNLSDSRRAAIRESIERMGSSERLARLTKVLDQADEKSLQVFKYYASLLGTQAIVPLCEMLGELEQMKSRRIICEAIAEMAQGHADKLESASKDPRWFVARNAAYILGTIKDPQGVKYLMRLAKHEELRVRKEAIRGLGAIGDEESRNFLLSCLQSSEGSIQVLAAGVLANLREKRALLILEKILENRQFLNRDREEKRGIFDAVGRLEEDHLLPLLKGFLHRKTVFPRAKIEDTREGAARALALIGTEAARRILHEGAGGNDSAISQACRAALSQVRFSARGEEEEVR